MNQLINLIKYNSPKEHYTADACIVWCFDDRFTGLLKELNRFGFKNIDLIKVAGGAKGLIGPESARAFLLDQIEKSIKLHHAPLIILMVHKNCGAYGTLSAVDENGFFSKELKQAKINLEVFLEAAKHTAKVKIYLADFDGLWEVR